jgi:hypothetical protein
MPTKAPIKANHGERKSEAAKNEKMKNAKHPSRVLAPLNGKGFFEIVPPIIEAVLSPMVKIAMAALLTGAGKTSNVTNMPKAKYIGASANWRSSD